MAGLFLDEPGLLACGAQHIANGVENVAATAATLGPANVHSIVEKTRYQHAYRPLAVGEGNGAKQRVDRWPVTVFDGPVRQHYSTIADKKVTVGDRHVNAALLNEIAVRCPHGW